MSNYEATFVCIIVAAMSGFAGYMFGEMDGYLKAKKEQKP